jgi:hypothetical protein
MQEEKEKASPNFMPTRRSARQLAPKARVGAWKYMAGPNVLRSKILGFLGAAQESNHQ